MMHYVFPIKIAMLTFSILAIFITIPFSLYQYRKYGYINKFRTLILYSFLLYLLCTYYLIILPLPLTTDIRSLQAEGTQHIQLIPFNFIIDIFKETDIVFSKPFTYINILKERAFLQAAFNGILLTPLGIYLRYYFKKDLKKTILITFLVSLFFELTQLSGLYGIYNAPYRLFDVDDLILNTFGGFLGYLIAPLFTYYLPKSNTLDDNIDLQKLKVGYVRRFFAFYIDWFILGFIPNINSNLFVKSLIVFIYFIVLVYLTNGQTLGKYLFKIRIKGKHEKLSFKEIFIRYGILYYGVFGVNKILFTAIDLNKIDYANYIIVIMLIAIVINLLIFVHLLLSIIKKDNMLFYEKLSNTKNIII
ncbi:MULTISPECIES: VanZ family protein [Clostridium]|uniref:VanZ family protein n=1 Tax=Clostridium aquiflavi TaxID=3073603 RepID=A0ABU1EGI0_9CLOT|nr:MULTISPECIES: VanZ family protein [unclassified Clostridium]MDR5587222.1 VanZ family protein [Clostridium sp. 5N-1]NFG61910.1 permease [Clostridium botulinum]NFQ08422.1 permease [Clostridium botulinum]